MSTSIPTSTLEKFTTFGDLLRYLRRAAGLTQLELSVQVGYSHAQISRLEQNLRLPDIPTIEARFVSALGLESDPKVVTRLLELAANVRREDAPGLGLCPYKGLNYFDESDADLFVGREALTTKLTERVLALTASRMPQEKRFLAIVGASGSGKSSLVRAGLVPALRWNKKSADWQINILTPTAHPLDSLAGSLTSDSISMIATSSLIDDLSRDARSLQIFVKRQLAVENQTRTLLVIDQFEETFALCRSEEERAAFIESLLAAASEVDGPVIVVVTLRADFYTHCANYIQLREALAGSQEYIGAMNDEELCRAIEEPARRGRWEFEPGLVELLLHDVGHEPGALPLLSHALFETWQRRRGRTMTLSGYTSSGGVRGAIAETAEMVFMDQFTSEQRSIARRIFLRLTELSDEASAADTRRRATFAELILKPEEATTTHTVLKTLADARLIITSEDSAEVAHEALIREWPTLRGWLEDNREGLRLHRQLTEAAHEWLGIDRSSDILYRGARLAQAREWAEIHIDEMNTLEHEFLAASIEASEREIAEREAQRQREMEAIQTLAEAQRQRAEAEKQRAESETKRAEEQIRTAGQLRKRAIYLAGAFTAALIMALAALFLSAQARQSAITAQAQQRIATSRELAAASISNLDVDPERSILLALEALDIHHTIEAEDALHRAIQTSRVQMVFRANDLDALVSVAFSPDGNLVSAASSSETVTVFDAATGDVLFSVDGHFAAFHPDGKRIASVVADGTVKMWNTVTGEEIRLPRQIDAAISVAFSPDGTRLATVTSGDLPKIWDANTGEELVAFPGHTDFVSFAFFSPECGSKAGTAVSQCGARLLTTSDDGTARVWDTTTGEQLLLLLGHQGLSWPAAFSSDGKRIATISTSEAYIWDAVTGERLVTLTGHTNEIYDVKFSQDGARLATGGLDRKVKVWDATSGRELLTLSGHTAAVIDLAFSPGGEQLITGSADGTARIWDLTPSHEFLTISANGSNGQIAFNMDGTRLATTDETGALQIWDTHSATKLVTLPDSDSEIRDLTFDPGGTRIFAAMADRKVKIWDTATGAELAVLSDHTSSLNAIAITKDGKHLATASDDYKVKIWDVSSDAINDTPLMTLDHSIPVFSVAFNSDGTRLVAGIQDGSARVWDTRSGEEIQVLRGHEDFITAIVFSPDETRMATSSWDGTARVWEVSTGRELFSLHGHTGEVTSIAYSPDGAKIATASQDGTAKLWEASSGEELLTFFGDGSPLNDIAFSSDGARLASGGVHGARVYILQISDLMALAETRITRSLTSDECQKYLHLDRAACTPTTSIPTTTAIPPTDVGRACQVTNTGHLYDHSFNEMIFNGLQASASQLAWDAKVLQSTSSTDFEKNIAEFLRGDCDLIIGLFPMMEDFQDAAEANPNQRFMFVDGVQEQPSNNIWSQIYATDQAAFLAGYVAASITENDKVGVFGGIDIPSVTDFMDGFTLGVAYYNEKNKANVEVFGWDPAKHEGLFVGGFCCAAEGRQITQQLLDQGADVILPVAGTGAGAGATYAVKLHGSAYIIGVDTDWAVTNPEYTDIVLTSIMKNYDVSVVHAVKAIEEGAFTGGIHIGTLETGEVGLAPFYKFDSLISDKVKADLEQITRDIIAGRIKTKP